MRRWFVTSESVDVGISERNSSSESFMLEEPRDRVHRVKLKKMGNGMLD